MPDDALAIYVHVPFCAKHCAYCDFNTYVERPQAPIVAATVGAIITDIQRAAAETPQLRERPVISVFFGGGTPTFLEGEQLAAILGAIRASFPVEADAEVTSEANPGSSDARKFAAMRAAGFNRLSIGVQAFDDALLVALDRFHTAGEAERALAAARDAGFCNVSLDLMFRLPHQTRAVWRQTLDRAIALRPEHLSVYALTLEPGTRFERLRAGGKLPLPDEDAELQMYEQSIARLEQAGYRQYEVSNFARPGFESRHNAIYWRNEEYLGFGPGAVSYLAGRRWKRERLPKRYVEKVAQGADLAVESECLPADQALGETIMLGLRMREGIPFARLQSRFGVDIRARYGALLERLVAQRLLIVEPDRVRLTYRGLLVADSVAAEFL